MPLLFKKLVLSEKKIINISKDEKIYMKQPKLEIKKDIVPYFFLFYVPR